MKLYLLLIAVVLVIALVFGLTHHSTVAHQMTTNTQSVNAIIDEAAR